jgi:hypothetical protein
MTKEQRRQWQALSPVRLALHGWAFTMESKLAAKLAAAQAVADALPLEQDRIAAEALLLPVRTEAARIALGLTKEEAGV